MAKRAAVGCFAKLKTRIEIVTNQRSMGEPTANLNRGGVSRTGTQYSPYTVAFDRVSELSSCSTLKVVLRLHIFSRMCARTFLCQWPCHTHILPP